jgi:predicted nucleotidyltransferase
MPIIDQLKDYFKDDDYSFVLLFGSYRDGTQKSTSDVDIGLFYGKDIDYKDLGFRTAMLESKIGKKIDMIILNDIYKKDPLFAFEILDNHTPLLINNEDSYITFKTSSQLYFLDHKPLIETNEKALLNRIKNDKIGERNFVTEA